MYYSNKFLNLKNLRKLSGFHFLILSILDREGKPLNRKEMTIALTDKKDGVVCISEKTLGRCIKELEKLRFLEYNNCTRRYRIDLKSYAPIYFGYNNQAVDKMIEKEISPKQFVVYLYLVRELSEGRNPTYEKMADDLLTNENNCGKYVKKLNEVGLINIRKKRSIRRNVLYNVYELVF